MMQLYFLQRVKSYSFGAGSDQQSLAHFTLLQNEKIYLNNKIKTTGSPSFKVVHHYI